MPSIDFIIKRLDEHLKTYRPEYYSILNPPLTDEGITVLEEKYDIKLPADLRALYQWKNGQGEEYASANFIDLNQFYSLDISLKMASELTEMFGLDSPENWWNKHWVPILIEGSDCYCYDLEGAFTGNKGQIIRFKHDDSLRWVFASNLAAFLKGVIVNMPLNICNGLDDTPYTMKDEGGISYFEANILISDFQQVLDYINGRQPGFLQMVKGVPRQELEAWQNRYSVELPSIYLDFMTVMGHSSGKFKPLGWYDHNFEELASQVAWMYSDDCPYRKDYPQDRYFLIGYVADESMISPYELFLDLDSCDGNDARLIEMGSNGVYNAAHRRGFVHTLGELLMKRAVLNFGNNSRA
jgi:cell wall assembly regulator SMI1